MGSQSLIFEQTIQAASAQLYRAFTNASALREWLCDIATVEPKPGGRFYLAWRSGYYTCGEYLSLEPASRLAFTWRGKDDPARSEVQLRLEPNDSGTRLRLEHVIPGEGEVWAKTIDEIERGWRDSLDNLASVLESGLDLRFVRRPMLGITISDFNAEIAHSLDVPVAQGVRLDSVVAGMGAQAAGLQAGDVLVRMDGYELTSFVDLPAAVAGKRAGDLVEIVFYRGPIQMQTMMELSQRSLHEIPDTPVELAQAAQSILQNDLAEMEEFLVGLSDEDAGRKPAPDEWSVKDVLAHLIHGERGWQNAIVEIVADQERWADDWGGNLSFHVAATVQAYPKLADLLDAFRRTRLETIALYTGLPREVVERKGSYWRIAYSAVDTPTHFEIHLDQIKAAIAAAREQ